MIATVTSLLARHPALFLDLHLSLDGDAELHDRLRGVPGLHARVMDAARQLAPLQGRGGFRLGATVTLSALNQHTAEDTLRELKASGLFRRLQVVLVRGNTFDPSARDFDPAVYDRCLEILREPPPGKARVGGSRVRDSFSRLVRDGVRAASRGERGPMVCLAGRTMLAPAATDSTRVRSTPTARSCPARCCRNCVAKE